MNNLTDKQLNQIGWKRVYVDINSKKPGMYNKEVIIYNPEYMGPEDGFSGLSYSTYYDPGVNIETLEQLNTEAKEFKYASPHDTILQLYYENKNMQEKINAIREAIPEKRNILWYLLKAKQIIELILSILNSPNVYTINKDVQN